MAKLVYLLLLLAVSRSATGLRCYVCSKSASDESDLCITNPAAVTSGAASVECSMKYCTIKRQESKNPAGKVESFYRGCESNPIYLNTMVEDESFKTYFRSCTADLCNIGNGIQSVSNGNLGVGGTGVTNLIVPGVGQSSLSLPSFFLIISLLSLVAAAPIRDML